MLRPVPNLADYGITPQHGFLPEEPPATELPAYYSPWETAVQNLQPLILAGRLRNTIENMPVLSPEYLDSVPEWRRAYSILGFLLHGYIWGGDQPADEIPQPLAIPLLKVAAQLELPPVATFAGLCLWNYKPIFADEPADSLENLATLFTFTGSVDEQWFYLVSIAIEARGARSIPIMLQAIAAARANQTQEVTECLTKFAEVVDEVNMELQKMYKHCDPHVFYHRIRPFLAGSKGMAELPRGIRFDDGTGRREHKHYRGGSNAQSSLIQFFDIVLGVEHRPTGESRPKPTTASLASSSSSDESGEGRKRWHNFLMEMRTYMPGPHRRFLEHVSSVSNIQDYVQSHQSDTELVVAFNTAVAMVKAIRTTHITMVSRYIVVKSREERDTKASSSPPLVPRSQSQPQSTPGGMLMSNRPSKNDKKAPLRGTGGTALIPFLKQARDETGEAAIGPWAKKLLDKAGVQAPKVASLPKLDEHADGQMQVVGLAGTWSMDEGEGGLCHW
ncbi:Indoleamine 2,3-dioxygenase [Microsporum audouinii]